MWGTLASDGDAKILTFERHIPRPVEKVWAALVTPARIGDWLCADAEIEPRLGGRFHLAFRNFAHSMTGEITQWDPPHTLEYTWPESAAKGHSLVLWRLHPTPGGCRLVMTHTLPGGGDVVDFASGWHWHLDALATAVDEVETPWAEPQWRALRAEYATRI